MLADESGALAVPRQKRHRARTLIEARHDVARVDRRCLAARRDEGGVAGALGARARRQRQVAWPRGVDGDGDGDGDGGPLPSRRGADGARLDAAGRKRNGHYARVDDTAWWVVAVSRRTGPRCEQRGKETSPVSKVGGDIPHGLDAVGIAEQQVGAVWVVDFGILLASGKSAFLPSRGMFSSPVTYQEVKVPETNAHHDGDGAAGVARRDSIELATSTIRPIRDVSRDGPCKAKGQSPRVPRAFRLHKTMIYLRRISWCGNDGGGPGHGCISRRTMYPVSAIMR